MKKRTLVTLMGMFGSLALSTALFAAEPEATTSGFSALDLDQDGSLSVEEAAANPALSTNWSTIDADENGVVDEAEFSAFEGMGSESMGDETSVEGEPAEIETQTP
jgi:Ca2+-binding EF-hand superfamily protein